MEKTVWVDPEQTVDKSNVIRNQNWINCDYKIGQKVVLIKIVYVARLEIVTLANIQQNMCLITAQSGFNAEQPTKDRI